MTLLEIQISVSVWILFEATRYVTGIGKLMRPGYFRADFCVCPTVILDNAAQVLKWRITSMGSSPWIRWMGGCWTFDIRTLASVDKK